MARILHVEDEAEWIELTQRALADHVVDSARNYSDALRLIHGHTPYDLALVDLDLERKGDGLGAEILDVLRFEYPSTRRIVVTGSPPIGGIRARMFKRYGVEEIIIKGDMTLPDLRMVVAEALDHEPDDIPDDVKIRKSELMQRYRDWRSRIDSSLRSRVLEAQEYAHNAGRLHGQSGRRAKDNLDRWLTMQEDFRQECIALESVLSDVKRIEESLSAMEALDQAVAAFPAKIRLLEAQQGTSG